MGTSPSSAATGPTGPDDRSPAQRERHAERYRRLIESIDDGFCVIEVLFAGERPVDYRFLEVNRAFAEQTGLENAAGRRMRELAPAHEEHWFSIYGQVALTGESTRFVQRAQALADRWFDVYAFRVDEPAERHVAILFRDITARVMAEQIGKFLAEISRDLLGIHREEEITRRLGPKIAAHFRASHCAFGEIDAGRRVVHLKNCWHAADEVSVTGSHRLNDFVTEAAWRDVQAGKAMAANLLGTKERAAPSAHPRGDAHEPPIAEASAASK